MGGGARRDERRGRAATAAALHNACLPARSFFEARFTPVIDDIVIGDRWEHLKADLDGVRFTRVVLAPSPDLVATERDVGRGKRVLGEKWARYLDGALRGRWPAPASGSITAVRRRKKPWMRSCAGLRRSLILLLDRRWKS